MEAGLDDSGVRFFQEVIIGNTHLHFCNKKRRPESRLFLLHIDSEVSSLLAKTA